MQAQAALTAKQYMAQQQETSEEEEEEESEGDLNQETPEEPFKKLDKPASKGGVLSSAAEDFFGSYLKSGVKDPLSRTNQASKDDPTTEPAKVEAHISSLSEEATQEL